MDDLQTKAAMLWPIVLAVVLGIGVLADRLRGASESGGNLATSWLNTKRRVQSTKRDVVLDAMQDRLNGLDTQVHALQTQVDQLQELNNNLRYDLGDSVAYGWDAYYEIKRLDTDSCFPRPPKRRRSSSVDEPPERRIPIEDVSEPAGSEHDQNPPEL